MGGQIETFKTYGANRVIKKNFHSYNYHFSSLDSFYSWNESPGVVLRDFELRLIFRAAHIVKSEMGLGSCLVSCVLFYAT